MGDAMKTTLLLLLSLTIGSTPALASRTARAQAKEAKSVGEGEVADAGSALNDAPIEPAPTDWPAPTDGSIWDYIETAEGGLPSPDERTAEIQAASAELQEERRMEVSFLDRMRVDPPVGFYKDPVGAMDVDPLHLDLIDTAEFDIPIDVNEDVIRWLNYFTGSGRKYYARWMARSTVVRPMMYEKLRAAGMPEDLVYLSMIESGYSTAAYSSAAAAGLWQFIPTTGREYDMRVDAWVDERRDPERSTDAAIAFLGDLYRKFGDWRLVWAGYNGGPGRVDKGIARHGTRDFWALESKNAFPDETDNYVPKIMAAAIIGKHPERYGFTGIEFLPPLDRDTVQVEGGYGLDVLARCAGITEDQLRELNPHLRQWATPPEGRLSIHVPTGKGESFLVAVADVPPEERVTFREHRVAKGETLGTIAKKYGVATSDLQRANHIKNANLVAVGQKLVIPKASRGGAVAVVAEAPAPESKSRTDAAPAARSKKSAERGAALVSTAGEGSTPPRTTTSWHTVSKGDSLSNIASRYGVKQADLMKWNGISNANHIQAGQKLKVYTPTSAWTHYTVRKGDTLSSIADKSGCSVADLKSWNKIGGSTIYAGQQLKVKAN